MEARTVAVRGGMFKTNLTVRGSGEPLLFLHGAGGLREGAYLDRLGESFTVYAASHPGFGASEGIEHIDDIIDLALYYYDLMDELGLDSAHLLGHSMGGMLAAEMAALCPHRTRRLVLSNPVGFWRDDAPVLDFFTLGPEQLLPYVVHDPESEAAKEAFPAPASRDDLIESMYQRMQAYASAGKFLWPIPDKGLKKRIHRVRAPTLIVWGESDGLVPPSYAEDFRSAITDARVVILKECAHMPMFERRDEFVSLVTEFLSS